MVKGITASVLTYGLKVIVTNSDQIDKSWQKRYGVCSPIKVGDIATITGQVDLRGVAIATFKDGIEIYVDETIVRGLPN